MDALFNYFVLLKLKYYSKCSFRRASIKDRPLVQGGSLWYAAVFLGSAGPLQNSLWPDWTKTYSKVHLQRTSYKKWKIRWAEDSWGTVKKLSWNYEDKVIY